MPVSAIARAQPVTTASTPSSSYGVSLGSSGRRTASVAASQPHGQPGRDGDSPGAALREPPGDQRGKPVRRGPVDVGAVVGEVLVEQVEDARRVVRGVARPVVAGDGGRLGRVGDGGADPGEDPVTA